MRNEFFLVNEPPVLLLESVRLPQGKFLVGRSSSAELFLPDSTVSRKHAEVEVSSTGVTVRDLGSENGTFVNGERVDIAHLKAGQHLRFGRVAFELTTDNAKGVLSRFDDVSTNKWAQNEPTRVAVTVRSLSPAQRTVLNLLLEGNSQKELARKLHLSIHTVNNHMRKIYAAFEVHSHAELLARLLQRPLHAAGDGQQVPE